LFQGGCEQSEQGQTTIQGLFKRSNPGVGDQTEAKKGGARQGEKAKPDPPHEKPGKTCDHI